MLKRTLGMRSALILTLGMSLVCSGAFAQDNDRRDDHQRYNEGDHRGDNRGEQRGDIREDNRRDHQVDNRRYSRGDRYHYRDGRWYKRGWFGWEFAISSLRVGAQVESLPPRHTTVVVDNTNYYHDDNVYYRQMPDGTFVVVEAPRSR